MISIPDELKRNFEDGKVIFFCGAGVSEPAGLLSFKKLTKRTLSDLLPPKKLCEAGSVELLAWQAFEEGKYDEALGILESPQHESYESKFVREKVRHHLSIPEDINLDKHVALARLAELDTERGRIVTTNFDPLFECAQKKLIELEGSNYQMDVHVAPSLPPAKPETFQGLAYLHGRLKSSPNDQQLVLTAANFGTAYMLEGWALRFVIDLFRHYHVVFIGYSLGDLVMRYLIQALAAARIENSEHFKDPYAFVSCSTKREKDANTVEQKWKRSGITPILYIKNRKHQQLWETLEKWGDDHRQGITGRRQLVSRLSQFPPVSNENDPANRDMAWALRDVNVARHFAEQTDNQIPDPGWITYLDQQGLFCLPIGQTDSDQPISVPLVTSQRVPDYYDLNEVTFHLGSWIAKCLNYPEVLDWVLTKGAILHREFRQQIRFQLDRHNSGNNSELRPALGKVWQLLSDEDYVYTLSAKCVYHYSTHSYTQLAPGETFAIQNFLNRLRPVPIFRKDVFKDRRNPNPNLPKDWCEIKIELFGIECESDIEELRNYAGDWDGTVAIIADDLTTRLREAMDWFREFGLAGWDDDNTFLEYRSISPHDQNKFAPTWTLLIALTRESCDIFVKNGNLVAATNLVQRWLSLPYPVFQRLAIHAITEHPELDINLGLDVILDESKLVLWDEQFRRELFRFLRKRGQDIEKTQLNRLTKVILKGPSREIFGEHTQDANWRVRCYHQILLRLHKLRESGASLPTKAEEAYKRIQQDQPWRPPGDLSEEFKLFISLGKPTTDPGDRSRIAKFHEISPEEFVLWLQAHIGGDFPPWEHSSDWMQFATTNTQAAVNLLKGAADKDVWEGRSWYPVLRECRQNQDISHELKQEVAEIFADIPSSELSKLNLDAARWFEGMTQQLSFSLRLKLWQKIWVASCDDEEPLSDLDFNKTLNHAGGILGAVLFNELIRIVPEVAPGQNLGFPEQLKQEFECIAVNYNPSSKLARVRMVPMLYFLNRIDPNWAKRTFMDRMDPEDENRYDQFLWEGFLWYANCPTDLFVAIKHMLFKILRDLDCIPERSRSRAVELFAYLAVPPNNEVSSKKAKGILLGLNPDKLKSVARVLNDMLQGAGERSPVLWRERIGPWFKSVWPRRRRDKSPELSVSLAQMAIESGNAFPLVVDSIKDVLISEKWNTVLIFLEREEQNFSLVTKHPKASLKLIDKIIHDNSDHARIKQLWNIISQADPSLKMPDSIERRI